ncbi:hypothetical protein [Halostella salina]|uniref:hypothetical protein n=1 Tax=Halostella salina TaxID=1547897 RepID=UPI000EF82B3D|nr:hypothetical protein [Halostella salina]
MSEDIIEEYPNGCRIVHEERNYPDLYHFERPDRRVRSFKNLEKARLYADVYEVTDGFNEKDTGTLGVPPTVARERDDIRMAYFAATMSVTYAARAFEIDVESTLHHVQCVRERADEQRSQETNDK